MSTTKVQIARINRLLKRHDTGHVLKTSTPRQDSNLGEYHVLDWYSNIVIAADVDLDAYEKASKEELTPK